MEHKIRTSANITYAYIYTDGHIEYSIDNNFIIIENLHNLKTEIRPKNTFCSAFQNK